MDIQDASAVTSDSLVISELKQVNLATDETRRAILERLVNGPMTSRAVAKELGISQQLAYHHLRKLIRAGFVEVRTKEKRGNKEIYFYHATAPGFTFHVPAIQPGAPFTAYTPRHPAASAAAN